MMTSRRYRSHTVAVWPIALRACAVYEHLNEYAIILGVILVGDRCYKSVELIVASQPALASFREPLTALPPPSQHSARVGCAIALLCSLVPLLCERERAYVRAIPCSYAQSTGAPFSLSAPRFSHLFPSGYRSEVVFTHSHKRTFSHDFTGLKVDRVRLELPQLIHVISSRRKF